MRLLWAVVSFASDPVAASVWNAHLDKILPPDPAMKRCILEELGMARRRFAYLQGVLDQGDVPVPAQMGRPPVSDTPRRRPGRPRKNPLPGAL